MPPPGGQRTVLAVAGHVLLRKNTYVRDGSAPKLAAFARAALDPANPTEQG
jgi:hypothetical protein